ncbi:hypothetical protein [Candidatus Manganitrophus noduliformans]|uniref:Uncharacterized protein n=1 Tax=Candidatus Manganitrophus noduliformans TaxID=2606439 RepID=A0A7X6I9H7_9BACT|nr:hypothetical protein [Candidatus Manganitrophus noduliformans]NKE69385.1 hypothetical protein [Candidatus Manganitrophus noduliformans]
MNRNPTFIDQIELPDEKMISVLRAMTPTKRLETAFYLARLARKMMWAQAASAHPEWTEEQIREEVARRTLLRSMGSDIQDGWEISSIMLGS